MATDKKNDEKVQDLPKNKIEADKAQQVMGGTTKPGLKRSDKV